MQSLLTNIALSEGIAALVAIGLLIVVVVVSLASALWLYAQKIYGWLRVIKRILVLIGGVLIAASIAVGVMAIVLEPALAQNPQSSQMAAKGSVQIRIQGYPGEGPDCSKVGMCRVLHHELAKGGIKAGTQPVITGTLSLERGALVFAPNRVDCSMPMTVAHITRLPFYEDMRLCTEAARSIGFSGIKVHRGIYPIDADSIATIRAEYSFGLEARIIRGQGDNKATRPNSTSIHTTNKERLHIRYEILRDAVVSVLVVNNEGESIAVVLDRVPMRGAPVVRQTISEILCQPLLAEKNAIGSSGLRVELRVELLEGGTFAESVPVSFLTPIAQVSAR